MCFSVQNVLPHKRRCFLLIDTVMPLFCNPQPRISVDLHFCWYANRTISLPSLPATSLALRIFEIDETQDGEETMSRHSMTGKVEERSFDPDLARTVADYMDTKVSQRFGGRIKRSEAVSAGLRFVARRFAISYPEDADLTNVKADLVKRLGQMIAEEHNRKGLAPRSIANGTPFIWPILLLVAGLMGTVWIIAVTAQNIWIGISGTLVALITAGILVLSQLFSWRSRARYRYRRGGRRP
jgi:hypothetical protein